MDKKLKARWVKALRSGRYSQTREMLKDGNGYCCLGVLLSVSKAGRWTPDGGYRIGAREDSYLCEGELGDGMLKRFGITDSQESRLIRMNDRDNKDFGEIAAYVEKKL